MSVRMPREINAISERFIASIIHHNQLPLVAGQPLLSERAEAPLKVIAAGIMGTDDNRERHDLAAIATLSLYAERPAPPTCLRHLTARSDNQNAPIARGTPHVVA